LSRNPSVVIYTGSNCDNLTATKYESTWSKLERCPTNICVYCDPGYCIRNVRKIILNPYSKFTFVLETTSYGKKSRSKITRINSSNTPMEILSCDPSSRHDIVSYDVEFYTHGSRETFTNNFSFDYSFLIFIIFITIFLFFCCFVMFRSSKSNPLS